MKLPEFEPAWWLPSAHLQTVWPAIFRQRPKLALKRERVELPDGDFIDLDWHGSGDAPLVLINHGLEGSINSHYARPIMTALANAGYSTVFMHFRSCSEETNRLPRSYHSGDTADIQSIVRHIANVHEREVFAAIGFSLGGNALLKWLGQTGKENPLKCAIAISVPFRLSNAAERLSLGFSRFYEAHLMRSLRSSYFRKFETLKSPLNVDVAKLRGFREFDDKITAPLHGFRDVEHYYSESSCKQYLKGIFVPTCILHSQDDPFMYPSTVPNQDELSDKVHLVLTDKGGHVGFVSGNFPWNAKYWHEEAICEFLKMQD